MEHLTIARTWDGTLPPPHRLNAFAMHGLGLRRRYLAMEPVPGEAPDFHRLEHFLPWILP
jgi:hypothetical protein